MSFVPPGIQSAFGAYYIPQPAARRPAARPGYPTRQPALGSAFPFDPNVTPHWGESCPAGYGGVPPYCWLIDPQTGLPTYPGAPGTEPAAPAPVPAQTAPAPAAAPAPAQAAPSVSWWGGLSTFEKAALIGAAGLTGYMLVTLLRRRPSPARAYTPNLRQVARRTPTGIPLVRGKRWGHLSAPKKYRRLGATRASQYAYPARFMYPIHNKKHVAAAKKRFTQHKADYPMEIRRVIARNINKAARRVGLEPDVKP